MSQPMPCRAGRRRCASAATALGLVMAILAPDISTAQPSDATPDAAPNAPVVVPAPAPTRSAEHPAVASPLKGVVKELRSGPLLMHGNYCGIGSRPGAPEPIDALDAACMRHDACTRTGTLPGCACNERLRGEAAAIALSPRTPPDIKLVASATASAMAVLICKTGGTVAVPIPLPR